MSLIFCDSFDHYPTADIRLKYPGGIYGNTTFSIVGGAARNGPTGMRATTGSSSGAINSAIAVSLGGNKTLVYAGFAFCPRATPTSSNPINAIFYLTDNAATPQLNTGVMISIDSSRRLRITNPAGSYADNWTGTALSIGTWYYVEVKAKFCTTSAKTAVGDVEVRVDYGDGNGMVVVNQITVNQVTCYSSSNTGFAYAAFGYSNTGVCWASANLNAWDVDDFYILDSSGTVGNTYLGNTVIECIRPNGAGASAQWTPNASTNYSRVNETSEDADTTYVSTSGVGNRDSYALPGIAENPASIFGVQVVSVARRDAGETTRTANVSLRISGTYDDAGTTPALTASYAFYPGIWSVNPATSVAFTKADIAAMEAGIKLAS